MLPSYSSWGVDYKGSTLFIRPARNAPPPSTYLPEEHTRDSQNMECLMYRKCFLQGGYCRQMVLWGGGGVFENTSFLSICEDDFYFYRFRVLASLGCGLVCRQQRGYISTSVLLWQTQMVLLSASKAAINKPREGSSLNYDKNMLYDSIGCVIFYENI